jgi:steroid delta-isomerase-like uncharacterized protein
MYGTCHINGLTIAVRKGSRAMATDFDKQANDIFAAISAHDVEKYFSFLSDDVYVEDLALSAVCHNKEEYGNYLKSFWMAIPDHSAKLTSHFASNGHACMEWIIGGTHTGDLPGLPATGRSFSIRGVLVADFRKDKISRISLYYDMTPFLQ